MDFDSNMTYAPPLMREARHNIREKHLACLFLANADKHRYENTINSLHNDWVKGVQTTYPSILDDAYAFLDEVLPIQSYSGGQYGASSFTQNC